MKKLNIPYAKIHLARLLEEVSRGEALVITKAGKPIAGLVPLESRAEKRRRNRGILGPPHARFAAAIAANPDVFFEPMSEEELRLWEDP